MGMLKEFKEFAMKGSVVDLAIGLVIGASFGAVVSTFTSSVIDPLVGLVIGKGGLSDISFTAGKATFPVGVFLQAVINFILTAFVLFMIVKAINTMKKKEEPAAPAAPPEDITLLREIRDALKK